MPPPPVGVSRNDVMCIHEEEMNSTEMNERMVFKISSGKTVTEKYETVRDGGSISAVDCTDMDYFIKVSVVTFIILLCRPLSA